MHYVILILLVSYATAFRCINFYGLETTSKMPVCSWQHPPDWYLDNLILSMEIDSVRIPFSYEYVCCHDNMQWLHRLVTSCLERNLSVILDYHRGYADHQGPSPIEREITFDMYSQLWIGLLNDFSMYNNIKALSLFNEYQGANSTEAEMLQLQIARIIENAYPGRYVYMLGCAVWGTDCRNMYLQLDKETFASRAMIEIHVYDFQGPLDPAKFPSQNFKVFVGEFGWSDISTDWAKSTISFFKERGIQDVCMWTIAHSADTGNLYKDDCETIKTETVNIFNGLYRYPVCLRGSRF